uniref:Acyl-CoA thioesterase 9 n=1 Tax=Mus musculus TaxID=10090 RepID=S4R266_MOUSE
MKRAAIRLPGSKRMALALDSEAIPLLALDLEQGASYSWQRTVSRIPIQNK